MRSTDFIPPRGPGVPAIVPTIDVHDPRLPGYTTVDVHHYFEHHLPSWFEATPGRWQLQSVRFTTESEFNRGHPPPHTWDEVTDPGRLVCVANLRGNFQITGPSSKIGTYAVGIEDNVQLMFDGCTGNYLLAACNSSEIERPGPDEERHQPMRRVRLSW